MRYKSVVGYSLHVLGGQLAYVGDVHPRHLVDHVGDLDHDVENLPSQPPGSNLPVPVADHRDLLGLREWGSYLGSNLRVE